MLCQVVHGLPTLLGGAWTVVDVKGGASVAEFADLGDLVGGSSLLESVGERLLDLVVDEGASAGALSVFVIAFVYLDEVLSAVGALFGLLVLKLQRLLQDLLICPLL